jgi:peptidoglycan/LPS O-acetylase OafA/YrhL
LRQEAAQASVTRYRPDIDGLRAVAVSSVVIYHASKTALPGGYLGVDVFFVISGFLITSILRREIDRKKFSLSNFYRRRARRILPAFTVLVVIVTLACLFMLPPDGLKEYGEYLTASATFVSNLWFREHSNYFGTRADNLVLLHTWSLSVEEQFYIFWPIGLWFLSRSRLVAYRKQIVLGAAALGLVGALAMAAYRPEAAFYYFPTRAWELLAGAYIALLDKGAAPKITRESLSVLGIVFLASAFVIAPDIRRLWAGADMILPCVGAALIIFSGGNGDTPADHVFSSRPFVWIGLISYSLYLWHWPVFVLSKIYLGHSLNFFEALAAIALATLLAFLSWRFVEQPFRKSHGENGHVNLIAIGAIAAVAALGFAIVKLDGLPQRASYKVIEADMSTKKRWRLTDQCLIAASSAQMPSDEKCRFGAPSALPSVVLWGDSHANHYGPALERIGQARGFSVLQLTKQSCSPVAGKSAAGAGASLNKTDRACADFRAWSLDRILSDARLRTVVIAGRWPRFAGDEMSASLDQIVETLTARGRNVVLVGTTPEFNNGGGMCIVHQYFLGRDGHACDIAAAPERAALRDIDADFQRVESKYPRVRSFLPNSVLCDDVKCQAARNGQIVLSDSHHLTIDGARMMAPGLDTAIRSLREASAAAH